MADPVYLYPPLELDSENYALNGPLSRSNLYWFLPARTRLNEIDSILASDVTDTKLLYGQLGRELVHLEHVTATIRARRAVCAPVSRLPTEILCKIFTYVAAIDRPGRIEYYMSWDSHRNNLGWIRSVTHVNHHWRRVSLGMKALWAYDVAALYPALSTLGERAQTARLRLSVQTDRSSPERCADDFVDFMTDEMENASIIDFKTHGEHAKVFVFLMSCRFLPSLNHLSLESDDQDAESAFRWHKLKALALRSCVFRDVQRVGWDGSSITHLELYRSSSPGRDKSTLTLQATLEFLHASPNLQCLRLHKYLPSSNSSTPPATRVCLSRLSRLSLEECRTEDCTAFMRSIELPNLQQAAFAMKIGDNPYYHAELYMAPTVLTFIAAWEGAQTASNNASPRLPLTALSVEVDLRKSSCSIGLFAPEQQDADATPACTSEHWQDSRKIPRSYAFEGKHRRVHTISFTFVDREALGQRLPISSFLPVLARFGLPSAVAQIDALELDLRSKFDPNMARYLKIPEQDPEALHAFFLSFPSLCSLYLPSEENQELLFESLGDSRRFQDLALLSIQNLQGASFLASLLSMLRARSEGNARLERLNIGLVKASSYQQQAIKERLRNEVEDVVKELVVAKFRDH